VLLAAVAPFGLLNWDWAIAVGVFAAFAVLSMLHKALNDSAWHKRRVLTSDRLAELVEKVVILNKLPAASSEWTDERIWLTLKETIVEQLGVQPDQVTPQAHYVHDLHAD
jgi:hypothetical protein